MSGSPKIERAFNNVAALVRPYLDSVFRKTWNGQENVTGRKGIIVVSNHLTQIDPLVVGHFLYDQGLMPHFMAKQSMFGWPLVGSVMRSTNQVPVFRGSADAVKAIAVAEEIVANGEALVVYPEGTLTEDPGLWPMRGYTGAARLALATGADVVPIAHWGDQAKFATRLTKPKRTLRRAPVSVSAGRPVDLADFRDKPVTRELLEEATERIMDALTAELAGLRGEEPPAERFDLRAARKRSSDR
ncbi:lysophospholipid acyltransferase family protein [Arthrobacter sp. UM1]|uniref:lysophospholipid acyltransferase family protein n=1 Tax=Arthrobacter sp. UM1 TaxID=2766776 RepID=UPI001CF6E611|nr:lysophospholipid acyltransferase family protein [Arthrobacter sp. UM1]MCB4207300.1 1-acyl-sn-glycerol-3-phosphate acyltransferase [Arthrobacter sp. UM1]